MRPTDPDERRRVRVQYVPRGFGLALTITDDLSDDNKANAVTMEACGTDPDVDATDIETNDGFLTVVASGITTLELRRPDGESSLLIWDESEVAWDSLRAG